MSSSTYQPFEEHSAADIDFAKKQLDAEQARRLSDESGEAHKRSTAFLVSTMVGASLRPNWFQQGSAYVLDLLKVAKRTRNDILLTASQAKEQVQGLGQKGLETASELKKSLERSASKTFETAQEKAQDAKLKSLEAVQDAKSKVQEGLDAASDSAQEVKQNIQTTAQQGIEKAQELTLRLKNLGLGFADKVTQTWENMTHNSLMAFAVLEEEKERTYRMYGEDRVYAILNAYRVSALIKAIGPEFYRPTFETSSSYLITLLEEAERSSRVKLDNVDSTSRANAADVARLITMKFAVVSAPIPIAKPQHVEPIHVTKPLVATM